MNHPLQLSLFSPESPFHSPFPSKVVEERIGTFTDNMKLPIHRWFRYSAGFSADWVEGLMRELEPQTILDPFAGSGTVCIVADQLQLNSYGTEAHPFVYKLAKGKLAWSTDPNLFANVVAELQHEAKQLRLDLPETIPPLLSKCYTSENLIALFKIKQAYLDLLPSFSEELKLLVFLAICAILRLSSHVGTAQWQYVLPNKRKAKVFNPFEALERQTALMQEDMYRMQSIVRSSHATFIQADARNLATIPQNSIDLVITSPPYANNYDYADATRLEMTFWNEVSCWADLHDTVRKYLVRSSSQHVSKDRLCLETLIPDPVIDPIRDELVVVCRNLEEIRSTKGGNKAYHTMVAAYFSDMGAVFNALRQVTASRCNICFVIGDSAPYGVYIPVEKWLGKLALASGFDNWSFEQVRQRNTKWKNRKHRVPLQEGRLWIRG